MLTVIKPTRDTKGALETLDNLREAVLSGQIIGFVGVGIEPDDTTLCWSFSTQSVSRLRMMGAIESLRDGFTSCRVGD